MFLHLLQADTVQALAEELASAAAPAAQAPVQPTQMNESLFSMFTMGGPLMWVLLAWLRASLPLAASLLPMQASA